jgi:ABC-type antimicrobial peptide transport system permease subunit
MTLRTLIARSLRFHWRGHLGVLLGAAVGSAALIGALVVGDSVRLSLRELALQRLGWVDAAMAPSDRFFTQDLDQRVSSSWAAGYSRHSVALRLPGTAARQDGTTRANQIAILGVRPDIWPESARPELRNIPSRSVVLNDALATQLRARAGDELVLRLHKPSALSRDVPITPQNDASIALRVRVHAVATASEMGNFNLQSSQTPPLNAFMNLSELASSAGISNQANLYLAGMPGLSQLSPRSVTMECLPGEPLSWRDSMGLDWFNVAPASVRHMIQDGPRSELLAHVLDGNFARSNTLPDLQLVLRAVTNQPQLQLTTSRIFIDPQIATAILEPVTNKANLDRLVPVYMGGTGLVIDAFSYRRNIATNAQPILTYLVNQLRAGELSVPYSMVTAAGAPLTPPDMKDDEVLINQWLADDLRLKAGDSLDLTYFLAESGASLVERTNRFRVRSIVPMEGIHGDRTLMPEFPGLAKAESTQEWDAGFPLVHKIRDQDEAYWKKYRGTPKAFVTLAAGQRMWANRFGNLTAIRFPVPLNRNISDVTAAIETSLLSSIDPSSLGLRFEPVRAQALAGASQSQDFGGLFIGFSFFLILAALILMALLFQFGIEQRTNEIGTLLALGFTPSRVRNLLLGEGVAIAFIGGLLGMLGGIGYAQAMLYGLATLWRDAVGTSALRYHVTPMTLVIGLFASVAVSAVTIWIVLRKQARRPARELLSEGAELNVQSSTLNVRRSKLSQWIAMGSGVAALGMIGWATFGGGGASAGLFFGAGGLLLIAGLAAVAVLLSALERSEASRQPTITAMGLRNGTRRRSRSLASVALLACGSYLVAAIGANRLDAGRDATKRSSGTGGFALFGAATLPVVRDLNSTAGREFYGLDEKVMQGVSVVPFRVRDGDDASCLNLNRAQTPRLLGVKPELLAERKAFTFAKILEGSIEADPWLTLKRGEFYPKHGKPLAADEIAAIGDAASIQWALGKNLGDTIEYSDERGQKFKLRLVAGVANSILQGNLIIDEAEFVKRFPGEAGHRMFLIDVPSNTGAESNRLEKTSAAMSRALQDVGLELTPTTQRLEAFNAVQNTYLNTFQILGGLGLLLGSAGLGVVVLRNVLERRSELGLLQAVGFRRRSLQWLVLSEHGGLLGLGLAVGITAAVAAVLPALLAPGAENQFIALIATLAGVFVSGLAWTWVATRLALRGELLKALRNE